jgi:hypothetical protein
MLALKVSLNGEHLCLAGDDDWKDLGVLISASRQPSDYASTEDHTQLIVTGETKPDPAGVSHQLRWKGRNLVVGSVVTVEVIETDAPDDPLHRYRFDHEVQEFPLSVEEYEEWEHSEWLRLKAKYEPNNTSDC